MNKFTIQEEFAISAGAGSGKTYTLSRRYINAYLGFDLFRSEGEMYFDRHKNNSAEIDEIVTMTFTNAAANEMKERIFGLMKNILKALDNDEKAKKSNNLTFLDELSEDIKEYTKNRLQKGITQINEAYITTIHGFALGMIKKYADYLKINIDNIVDELEQEELFIKSFNIALEEFDLDKLIENIGLYKLKIYAKKFVFDTEFQKGINNFQNDINEFKVLLEDFYKIDIQDANEEIDIQSWYDDLINFKNPISFNEYIEAKIGESLNFKKKEHREKYQNIRIVKDNLKEEMFYIDNDIENKFKETVDELKIFLNSVYNHYQKNLEDKLDFNKIIQYLYKLLDIKEIKFKYVMVDEFQDSNHLQYEIAKKIAKNLFIVGDEKQSIYSFQGGDIEVFKKAQKELQKVEPLDENRRSDKKIIEYVNKTFKELFKSKKYIIEDNYKALYHPLKAVSQNEGSIEVLYYKKTPQEEAESIANLIAMIINGEIYPKIKEYIDKHQKAIGIIYDSKTHMHYLKKALEEKNISAKINGVETFWEEEEIKDIMAILKVREIIKKDNFNKTDKFYLTGALNSKIYQKSDKEIYELLEDIPKLKEIFIFDEEVMHKFIRKMFITNKAYTKYKNPNSAKANIEELIKEVINLEEKYDYNQREILKILEDNFFNASKKIASYDSEVANSIELSSIHYTKGLDYPLIILANANKRLSPNREDAVIYTKYTYNQEKFVIGFKIDDYAPLAYRVANFIDKLKYYEEKKRLLYVALTRAKHHIVISSTEKFNENSYSNWLNIDKLNSIEIKETTTNKNSEIIKVDEYEGDFVEEINIPTFNTQANLGVAIHRMIELEAFDDEKIQKICDIYGVEFDKAKKMIKNFINSDVYKELKLAKIKEFEWEFEDKEGFGRIDLWYEIDGVCKIVDFKTGKIKDYSSQLKRYENALKNRYSNIKSCVLYLGDNND